MKTKKKFCDGCGELRHIWKNASEQGLRKRYCKYCWSRQDNFQHKPSTVKPLRFRSPKRKKEEARYQKLRLDFLTKNSQCEAGIPGRCTHYSTDVHHMMGRIGALLTDTEHFLSVCRSCHTWIELNPLEAKEKGFSKTRI